MGMRRRTYAQPAMNRNLLLYALFALAGKSPNYRMISRGIKAALFSGLVALAFVG